MKNFSAREQRRLEQRGQASLEYLAVLAFTLGALVVVWVYVSGTTSSTKQDLNVAYARQIVLKLRDAADLVYAQGPPSQLVIEVNVPDSVEEANVSGQEILLRVRSAGGLTDVYSLPVANVTGDLSALKWRAGQVSVTVKAQRQGTGVVVNITA